MEAKENREPKVLEDFQVPQEMLAKGDPWESEVKLGLKVPLENLVLLEAEECLAQMDQWDPKASQGIGAKEDPLVQRVNLEILVDPVRLGFKD